MPTVRFFQKNKKNQLISKGNPNVVMNGSGKVENMFAALLTICKTYIEPHDEKELSGVNLLINMYIQLNKSIPTVVLEPLQKKWFKEFQNQIKNTKLDQTNDHLSLVLDKKQFNQLFILLSYVRGIPVVINYRKWSFAAVDYTQ